MGEFECDPRPMLRNSCARLDLIATVATVFTCGCHHYYLLEVGDVWHIYAKEIGTFNKCKMAQTVK